MSNETLEQAFTVTTPARLKLSNIRGSVEIRSGEDRAIRVTAVKHADSGDTKRTEIELLQEADGTVKVATRFPEGSWGWLFGSRPCRVDFIVTAPRQCSLKVNGVSSDIRVENFDGEFEIGTVSGDLILGGLSGPLHLHTVSGAVTGERMTGTLVMDTVSGDVRLNESSLGSVKAETVSGKMDFQTALGEGPYYFGSVSGAVRLRVPPETGCSVELRSVSGKVSAKLPVTAQTLLNGAHLLQVQNGGVEIRMNSVSGWLAVE
jgi:DUF4097 and DUF4098 domain-containing protein YvlB